MPSTPRASLVSLIALLLSPGCARSMEPRPACPLVPPRVRVHELSIGGERARIEDGVAFVERGGRRESLGRLYDPGFFEANYAVEDCRVFRVDERGRRFEVRRRFSSGFEEGAHVRDLLTPEVGWTGFTLQSPMAPTVRDYVALRSCVVAGTCDFRDNRLDIVEDPVHGGRRALRATAVAPEADMVTAKSSLESELVHFVKGDDVWFRAWFFIAQGQPFTLFDLESGWIEQGPGPRVVVDGGNGALYVELKWGDKPKYRQSSATARPFPRGRWTQVRVHYRLSEGDDGLIELWQDDVALLSTPGSTLPLSDAILNRLEIGISANNAPGAPAVLHVDDVEISDRPL